MYTPVILKVAERDYRIEGTVRVLTEGDVITFLILDEENFELMDIIDHACMQASKQELPRW